MQLLQYLGHTSPECLENLNRKLNEPAAPPMSVDLENEAIASVISQRNTELDESRLSQQIDSMSGQRITRPTSRNSTKSATCDTLSSHQGNYLLVKQVMKIFFSFLVFLKLYCFETKKIRVFRQAC